MINTDFRRILGLGVVGVVGLFAGGCDLWPRDNPLDPVRCSPRCTGGKTCVGGVCVAPDAGVDGPLEDASDDGDTAVDSGPDAAQPPRDTPPCATA